MRIRFQRFELDEESFLLTCDGERVPLRPKAFDLLSHLIRNRDRVVRREELVEVVWGSTAVCVGSLAGLVNELRGALGERGRGPSSIRTVHARGYQFVAEISFPGENRDVGRDDEREAASAGAGENVGVRAGESRDGETDALAALNALVEAEGMAALPSVLAEALLAHVDGHAVRLESIVRWLASRRGPDRSDVFAGPEGSEARDIVTPDRCRVRRVDPSASARSRAG